MNESQKHNDPEALLCDYLDGRLSHRQRRLLEKRIEQDGDLREQLHQYAALDGMFEELSGQSPEGFDFGRQRSEIVAAAERKALLDEKRHRPTYLRPVFTGLAAAASLVLLVGAVFMLLRHQAAPQVSEPAVSVQVLPVSQPPTGQVVVSVTLTASDDPVPAPARPAAVGAQVPRGTVVVSVGARPRTAPKASEAMLIY